MAGDLDLRDVGEFRQTLAARPPAIVHGTAGLLVALIGGAATWAALTDANLVVRGPARVRPADAPLKAFDAVSNEEVYAEASGRVVAIDVAEGQRVTAGTVLARLDTSHVANEIARLASEIDTGEAEVAAIDRMSDLLAAQFAAASKRGQAEVARAASSVHHSRERMVSDQRLAQVELDEALEEQRRAQDLVDRKAGPAADVVAATARVDRARERLAAAQIGIDDGEPEILRRGLDQARRDHEVKLADLARQRAAKQGEVAAARTQLANLELERDHATIRAHRAGIVTLGGLAVGDLVAVGKLPLAITAEGALRVDAAVSTADVGLLRVGLSVRVKLDAYDYQRYGTADGTIVHVASDTAFTADGRHSPYYLVSVALSASSIGRGDWHGDLKVGMTGEIEAITGRESLLSLFVTSIHQAISL